MSARERSPLAWGCDPARGSSAGLVSAKQPFHFRVRVSTVADSLADTTVKLRLLRTTYCSPMARPIHKLLMRKQEDPWHTSERKATILHSSLYFPLLLSR